jgi:hypothetical protein
MSKERLTEERRKAIRILIKKYFTAEVYNDADAVMITNLLTLELFAEEFARQEVEAAIAERMPTDCRTCNELGHPCWLHDPSNPDNNKRMQTEEDTERAEAFYEQEREEMNEPVTEYTYRDWMAGIDWFRSRMEEKK